MMLQRWVLFVCAWLSVSVAFVKGAQMWLSYVVEVSEWSFVILPLLITSYIVCWQVYKPYFFERNVDYLQEKLKRKSRNESL